MRVSDKLKKIPAKMRGVCKLYDIEADLKKSHIIPKFAFDYMKETGGKFLRNYDNPDKRVQDGITKFLLSEKAEQEFSKRERWFTNNIFYPYLKDSKQIFDYDENFAYFVVSLLWRVIIDNFDHPSSKNENLFFLNDVANEWKEFLANSKYPINYNNINVILTDRISSQTINSESADLYISRMIDATIVTNKDYSYVAVYAKFLRFMFWSIVKGDPSKGNNIKIDFAPNKLILPQSLEDEFFGGFIYNRIKEIDNSPKASEAQQQKIIAEILKNEKDFWNSDAGKSMINDYNLKNKASR